MGSEIVLPEIDDLKLLFPTLRQPVTKAANGIISCASSNHLPQLNLRLNGFHEYEVDRLGDINARIEHIYRDREPGMIVLLKFGDQTVPIGAIVYPFHPVIDGLN